MVGGNRRGMLYFNPLVGVHALGTLEHTFDRIRDDGSGQPRRDLSTNL